MLKVVKWIIVLIIITVISYPVLQSYAAVRGVGTRVKKYWIGLSTDTKPTPTAIQIGALFKETDTNRLFVWDSTAWYVVNNSISTEGDSLIAPGNFPAFSPKGFDEVTIALVLTAVNTSVGLTIEGRIGTAGWENLYQADSLVVTSNDSYYFTYSKCASLDSVRAKWISEAGGTNAVIDIVYKLAKTNRGD